MDFSVEIKGHSLEYLDEVHTYLIDGVIVPSVTQILKTRFGSKYSGIDAKVLKTAADNGTAVHNAIEQWCKTGEESDFPELAGFKILKEMYGFEIVGNEIPVILFMDDKPFAAGRMDLVIQEGDQLGLGDIKRTSTLDKEYLAYQLNLYRIAYQQCTGEKITFLRGVHLRKEVRKYVEIPIDEEITWQLVEEFKNEQRKSGRKNNGRSRTAKNKG